MMTSPLRRVVTRVNIASRDANAWRPEVRS
jgi:hypothetical protein